MDRRHYELLLIAIIIAICSHGQPVPSPEQDSSDVFKSLPGRFLHVISSKTQGLEKKLARKSEKALQKFQKQEARLKKQLSKIDSLKANEIFGDAQQQYNQLKNRLTNDVPGKQYIPALDSLGTSLKFLQQSPQLLAQTKQTQKKLKESLEKVKNLKNQFQKAEEIKKFLRQRKQYLKERLSKIGFAKELRKLSKEAYYYSEQLNQYKELLKDHTKAEKKALELLSKTTRFTDFMRKNSQLASLFRLPGNPNDPSTQANLAGLQTRIQINNLIQQQLATGRPAVQQQFQQNIQAAQAQIQQLKDKINKSGGSSDDDIPNFRTNGQKTKSFGQRLEYGFNLQAAKARHYFPNTADMGLSLGYRLNDKSVIGIGASYKLGLGTGWRNIDITQQGTGVRSFLDWKLKGSLWLSGGFEMNYRTLFNSIDELRNLNAWQRSGLIGLSKKYKVSNKLKGKIQLLWDFLSNQQVPRTQSIIFRIGYNIK